MNYHDIVKDDMRNGDGLRVTLFVAGCNHHCRGCHNPQTWDPDGGIEFDQEAMDELMEALDHDYISGLTISGGDPLHPANVKEVTRMVKEVRKRFQHKKTIWVYTGYKIESVDWMQIMHYIDVLVDGRFDKSKADVNHRWGGSTNQRVIDVQASMMLGKVVPYE